MAKQLSRYLQALTHFLRTLTRVIAITWQVSPRLYVVMVIITVIQGLLPLASAYLAARLLGLIAGHILHPGQPKDVIEPSGGQWQRIALARAFYRNADILILDEPTSAIDAKGEYEVFAQIAKTQRDKTSIIISHRFSTVRHAGTIVVLEDGRVREQGSHEELLRLSAW